MRAFYGPAWKPFFKAGQTRARVSAPVQFLLSFGLKTLITLGDAHSLRMAVVYLNLFVFRTDLDSLFSFLLALAWELYGSFGICNYSKFWFCGLNERNGAWVRFIVPSNFMRQDLSSEVFSLCFTSKFFYFRTPSIPVKFWSLLASWDEKSRLGDLKKTLPL